MLAAVSVAVSVAVGTSLSLPKVSVKQGSQGFNPIQKLPSIEDLAMPLKTLLAKILDLSNNAEHNYSYSLVN